MISCYRCRKQNFVLQRVLFQLKTFFFFFVYTISIYFFSNGQCINSSLEHGSMISLIQFILRIRFSVSEKSPFYCSYLNHWICVPEQTGKSQSVLEKVDHKSFVVISKIGTTLRSVAIHRNLIFVFNQTLKLLLKCTCCKFLRTKDQNTLI